MEGGIPDERQSKAQRGGIAEHRPKLKGSECAPQMAPLTGDSVVDLRGVEPLTSALPRQRSTN